MRPIDVILMIVDKLLNMVYSSVNTVAIQSDSVRVSKFKTIFEKDYTSNWTTKVFRIVKVQKINSCDVSTERLLQKIGRWRILWI